MRAIGQWIAAWDPFFALDPEWTDEFMTAGAAIYGSRIFTPKDMELISMGTDTGSSAGGDRPLTERIAHEIVYDIVPKVLFFFVAFGIIFLLFELFVAQYSIQYAAFTRAAIAALILGKVVPILDWVVSGWDFWRPRRIVWILARTLVYAFTVIALGTAERLFSAYRQQRSLALAFQEVWSTADGHHFLGLVLLLSLVVGAYLTAQEIDRALGQGGLRHLLLERPSAPGGRPGGSAG